VQHPFHRADRSDPHAFAKHGSDERAFAQVDVALAVEEVVLYNFAYVTDELVLGHGVVSADNGIQTLLLGVVQGLHQFFVSVSFIGMVFGRQRAPRFNDLLLCAVGADVERGEGA
jgi:hypothetical protein